MPANVETMFYVRTTPWHGLGTRVESALSSEDALVMSGLNWNVIQKPIMTSSFTPIPGFKANIRDTDNRVLGVVTDRYRVVQNSEAFAFTDALLGEGVKYETAGSLQDGRKIWILAKLPDKYIIEGEQIDPYLVFSSSHDGSGSIKVAMTPVRVVCSNTLNLALTTAKRMWCTVHVGDLAAKMDEAHNTLLLAEKYMGRLGMEFSRLSKIKLTDQEVLEYIDLLLPMDEQPTEIHRIAERNRIVEENLPIIDKVIRHNWALVKAAHLDYDDVYQDLAVRLIRAVENYDPNKGALKSYIYCQLRYELLNCKAPRKRTGIAVTKPSVIYQSEEYPFMLANVDGTCEDAEHGTCLFEAKTASAYKAGEWENGIPDEYMCQVQHYMAVTGAAGTYIAVLIGGNVFKWRFIERDEELISLLIELESDFWKHVESQTPPQMDGSDASAKFLAERFPSSIPKSQIDLPDSAAALLDQYAAACEQLEAATEQKQEAENKLKEMLGDNEIGTAGSRVITWKSVSQERLDSKTLKAEHPQLCQKYTSKTSYRRFTIKAAG